MTARQPHHCENGVWFDADGWSIDPAPRPAVYHDPIAPELANPYRHVDGYSVIVVDTSIKS